MGERVELARLVRVDEDTTYADVMDALDELEAAWFAMCQERERAEDERGAA